MQAVNDFILTLRQLARTDPNPAVLQEQAIPLLLEALQPIAESVEIYRATHDQVTQVSSPTNNAEHTITRNLKDLPYYAQALQRKETVIALESRLIITPIIINDTPELLIKIAIQPDYPLEDHAGLAKAQIDALIQPLTLLLESLYMQQAVGQLTHASNAISSATTYQEVATILAQSVLERGQFLTINVLKYADNGETVEGFHVVASANRKQAYVTDDYFPFNHDTDPLFFNQVDEEQEVYVPDLATAPTLSEALRERLMAQKIRSMYLVPLKTGRRRVGSLSFNDTRPAMLVTPAKRMALQSLAGLVAISIENRDLFHSVETSLDEARTLYETTRALMQASDIPAMLRVLDGVTGNTASSVTLTEIDYDEQGKLATVIVTFAKRDNAFVEVNTPLHQFFTPDEIAIVQAYWHRVQNEVEFIEDPESALQAVPSLRKVMQMQQLASGITVPIYEKGRRERYISLYWATPQVFGERTRRLMTSMQSQIRTVLQNRRYVREAEQAVRVSGQQVRVLRLLNELASTADTNPDMKVVLQLAARVFVEATGADHCGIALIEADQLSSQVVASYPADTAITDTVIDSRTDTIALTLRQQRTALVIENIETSDAISDGSRQLLLESGTRAGIFVPMFDLDNNLTGTVGLDWHQVMQFDPETVDIARSVVTQLGISLQKLRLLESRRYQAEQMQKITVFSQAIQSSLDARIILEIALTEIRRIIPLDYITILIYDDDNQILRLCGLGGREGGIVELPGATFPVGTDTLAQRAWETETFIKVDDLREEEGLQHPRRTALRTLAGVPLSTGTVRVGVLEVGAQLPYAYGETDLAALQQICNQLAVALTNAEVFNRSQKTARNKALASEIAAKLQEQMDVDNILNLTALELGRALGAKRARIRLGGQNDSGGGRS
jgi:GAF domain-containing protein